MVRSIFYLSVLVLSVSLCAMNEPSDCRQRSVAYWVALTQWAADEWRRIAPERDFDPIVRHLMNMSVVMQKWYQRNESTKYSWPWYVRLLENHASSPTFQIDCEASKCRFAIALLNNLAGHLPQELESHRPTLHDMQAAMEPMAAGELQEQFE